MALKEKEINSKVNEGYIHFRAIIEILGKPKQYVEDTLKGYIEKIKKDDSFIIVKEDYAKIKPMEDMFTIFGEVEILAQDTSALVGFCFDYMPASVEILAPEKVLYDTNDFSDLLNDLQARLHAVNMGMQDNAQKNENLVRNTSVLLKNFVFYAVKEPRTIADLNKITGITAPDLQRVLDILIEEKKVVKKGDKYSLK